MEDFYYSYKSQPEIAGIDLDFSELADNLSPYFDQRYQLKSDLEALQPYPGWAFWYRASDAILDVSNKVSSLPDRSLQLLAATQTEPSRRPAVLTDSNGDKSISFNSTQDLVLPSNQVILPFIFWAVVKCADTHGLFDSAPSSGNVFRFFPQNSVEIWDRSPNTLLSLPLNSWVLLTIEAFLDANLQRNLKWYKNGILQASQSSNNSNQVAFTIPRIGSINLNPIFAGEIKEVGLCPFRGEVLEHNNNYLLGKYQL